MILRAKILLLWLLTLAIPVQGFAAVLQACAPAMAQSASADAAHEAHRMAGMLHDAQARPMQAASHQHEHHASPSTHAGHAGHDMSSMQLADAAHDHPAHAQHAQHKSSCSYCAACTTGALLPLALNAPPVPNLPSREFIALPASGFVGFLPENPDRPPALL